MRWRRRRRARLPPRIGWIGPFIAGALLREILLQGRDRLEPDDVVELIRRVDRKDPAWKKGLEP